LDLGLESAGFDVSAAVEMDADAVKTLRHNRDWVVIDRDIHEVSSDHLLADTGLKEGEADLLAGGPPCQPFSKSGYWVRGDSRRLDDPRASTLEAYLRVVRDLKPKVFLLENVAGLAYRNKDEGLDLLRRTIDTINQEAGTEYVLSAKLLNAADYGAPQLRERFFVVGHREGEMFRFPARSHGQPMGGDPELPRLFSPETGPEAYRTTWDAIGDCEDDDDPTLAMTGKWADLLPSIPEGQNYLYHTDRGSGLPLFGWRRRYWSFLLKLAKELPSWTLTAQPGSAIGPFHWKNRRLSMRELCRLQTFPDDYVVLGGRPSYQKQIGNAVPSVLAEVLGLQIRRTLLDSPPSNRQPKLVPSRRVDPPPSEPVAPVPNQYRDLIGDHSPHPGTGKGWAAIGRKIVATKR